MRRYYTQLISCLLAMGFYTQVEAQDPRFSQFHAAPLHLNPALTGVFDGEWRAALNYRNQWASIDNNLPYRTIGASFDWRYNIARRDFIAVGGSLLAGQEGSSQFQQAKGHVSVSYIKQLSGGYGSVDQFLVAGAQVGFGQYKLSANRLWFSSQFNNETETLNLSNPSGEFAETGTGTHLDLNAGLLWYATFNNDASLYVGGSLSHINSPNISFTGNQEEVLAMRWVGHVGGEIALSSELSILPAIIVMGQNTNNSYLFGSNIRYTNNDWNEIAVRIGAWMHLANNGATGIHSDAVIFATTFELNRFDIGLSYDVNVSSLVAATNSRGTYELSFIYTQPAKRRFKVNCPKF